MADSIYFLRAYLSSHSFNGTHTYNNVHIFFRFTSRAQCETVNALQEEQEEKKTCISFVPKATHHFTIYRLRHLFAIYFSTFICIFYLDVLFYFFVVTFFSFFFLFLFVSFRMLSACVHRMTLINVLCITLFKTFFFCTFHSFRLCRDGGTAHTQF